MVNFTHYVRTDKNKNVIYGFSNAFEKPTESDIVFSENEMRHFNTQLWYKQSIPIFYVSEGTVKSRSQEDLEILWSEHEREKVSNSADSEKILNMQIAIDALILDALKGGN